MAKGFDVLNVKSAVKARNKIDLNSDTLASMSFGQIVPLWNVETIPGDDINVNGKFYSRMAPLAKPTYGKFSFRTLSGFVPYHQIADDADAWISGSTSWEGESVHQRYITMYNLGQFIYAYCTSSANATENNADFRLIESDNSQVYRVLTPIGKYYVKILNALGYAMPEGFNRNNTSIWYTNVGTTRLSAYPLLAFFKLYNDYMSQSQRYNTSELTSFLKNVKHGKSTTGYTPSTGELNASALKVLFENIKLCYENDYFTSAWQNPNAPISGDDMVNSIGVPGSTDYIGRFPDDNELMKNGGDYFTSIGQRALDFLKSFDDWVRRNNYSGSRTVQRIYSRFGIKTDDYRSNYAHILDTDIMPIQVGDVTATAQQFITDNNPKNVSLGDYAGKGILSGDKSISYKATDYGLLMLLGWFTVTPMNPYGYDRKVLRSSPLDYYNPEFDGIGAEAISAGEYFASPIVNPENDTTLDTDVFGFTERYNSYRYGRDVIIGDFRKFRNNDDMNTWHTGRLLTDVRQAGNLIAQSTAVNTMAATNSEYNRIFSITDDSEDKFYLTCQFRVPAIRPMLNLNQVVRLGEGGTKVPRNGNVVD